VRNQNNNPLPQISARDLAFILYKRRWSVVVIVFLAVVGALAWLLFIREDVYAVSARILVKIGREQAPPPTVLGGAPLVVGYRTAEVNSEMEIFQSSELLERVINKFKLDQPAEPEPIPEKLIPKIKHYVKGTIQTAKDWENEVLIAVGLRERLNRHEQVLKMLQEGLNVKAAKDSNVFVAVLGTPFRQGGSNVLNALLDEYLAYRQGLYANDDFKFFDGVVGDSRDELRRAEVDLQAFEDSQRIANLPKEEESLINEIERQRSVVRQMESGRDQALFRVQTLNAILAQDDPNFGSLGDFPPNSFEQGILNQLAELQREREKLRLTEYDKGEKIQNNRSQFRTLAGMLEANLRTALTSREGMVASAQNDMNGMLSELNAHHAKTQQLGDLKRRVADVEGNYLTYRKKLTETQANSDMQRQQIGNVAIIERARDPFEPVGIRKTTLLGLVLLAAIFCALAWVAIAEFFDNRIYSQENVEEYLGAPVLAVVAGKRR